MSAAWTGPADIVAKVRRRWDTGALLRSYAAEEPFDPISIALRGPRAGEIGDDLAAARRWVASLETAAGSGRNYELRWRSVGGRSFGRNEVPTHAVISTREQVWALLGVAAQVSRFDELLSLAKPREAVRDWLRSRPLQGLELASELPQLVAALDWLESNRGSGRYLRQITAPGVDTKFTERHRAVLARILGVSAQPAEFLAALGLQTAPSLVHLRPAPSLGLIPGLSEIAVRADELETLDLDVRRTLVVENRITYLSVPVPEQGVVVWGQGFDVGKVGRLPWLANAELVYWGDLDPRGFEILNLLRRHHVGTRSVLMDRETLLRHRERWVSERTTPTPAVLDLLTPDEHELYRDLVGDSFGDRVRLEQERIDWAWALQRLGH